MDRIECPNPTCHSLNPETNRVCQVCDAPLPRVYLWLAGDSEGDVSLRDPFRERYVAKGRRLFMDSQPGRMPLSIDNIPLETQPYLRLLAYRLHLPQVYAAIPVGQEVRLLLQRTPLTEAEYGQVLVTGNRPAVPLATAWPAATGFRQLNWLWQIAQLWQPFLYQQVGVSLLQPDLLRVEGPLLRVQELRADPSTPPTAVYLGKLWQSLLPATASEVAPLVEKICDALVQEAITTGEQLVHALDQALVTARNGRPRQVTVAASTDPGPTRNRNEDACFPKPDILAQPKRADQLPYAIVCDGIGGHDGGDMASTLAIQTITQQMDTKVLKRVDTRVVAEELVTLVCNANDRISQLNNQQQRQERQRMGTTLTMALVRDHEVFLANVGDSRIYWITQHGCYQATTDDDVASREVRLGYCLYRQALRLPAAGALVQALGINTSNLLHPTVQRLILDEDCAFLLCSDGLSDNDLVETYWEREVLPVLTGNADPSQTVQQLVDLANIKNGHDNVTVVLVHYQVLPETPALASPTEAPAETPTLPPPAPPPPARAPRPRPAGRKPRFSLPLPLLLGILALGGLGVWFWPRQPSPDSLIPLPAQAGPASPLTDNPDGLTLKGVRQIGTEANQIALSRDGKAVAIAGADGSLQLWPLGSESPPRRLGTLRQPVNGVAFSPTSGIIATSTLAGITLWDGAAGRLLQTLPTQGGAIFPLVFSRNGRFLASGDFGGTLQIWDWGDRRPLKTIPTGSRIYALAFSPDGATLASGHGDGTVRLWNVDAGTLHTSLPPTEQAKESVVWSVTFSPDGQLLASGGDDEAIYLWNAKTGRELRKSDTGGSVYDLAFSPDGRTLVVASGPTLQVWDVISGRRRRTLEQHQQLVRTFVISPDGKTLVAGSTDKTLSWWQVTP
ncbi:MAG: protein phosphatase 2C domain-containing protein [Gloeomargaritaceae cyanobacterium C42_A2020_066]|nr:protein phosphatase 2C domain-containing protein [Gloeomargaritaceae cyanobacterium C42_A2020_066]